MGQAMMSELHMGLIGLGALGVLGVVAYNAWVSYRHRKLASRLLDPLEKDALFDTLPAQPDVSPDVPAADETMPAEMPADVGDEAIDRRNREESGALESADGAVADECAQAGAPVGPELSTASASPSFIASASRWLGALHLPRSGERVPPVPDKGADERIEPALSRADGTSEAEDVSNGAGAWQDAAGVADDGVFGEILASRPFDESQPCAPSSEHTAISACAAPGYDVGMTLAQGGSACSASPDALAEPWSSVGEPMHLLSPAIDYIATLEAASGASATEWLTAQRATLSQTDKPVHWAGFDEESGEWVILAEGGSEGRSGQRLFRHVRAGLQLADRRGAASENDLLIFATAMDALARDWQAQGRQVMLDLPDPRPVPAAAADLDAFCAGVDIQISLNVVALGDAFPGTKIRALAESAGMAIDGHGRFVRADDDGNVLYMLINHDPAGFSAEGMRSMRTHGVTFLFDVPTVARGERIFGQLVDLAKRFAEALMGALVDDNRRPLSDAALVPIRQQIAQFQARMAQHNLPAGGRMARRLFS